MDLTALATLAKPYVASTVRHATTAGAGYLASSGVIASTDQAETAKLLGAVALFAIGQVWSWVQKHQAAKANG